jgi:hypothetical protein
MDQTDDLRHGMRELVDLPHPPVRADIDAARTQGRRMIVRRRVTAIAGSAVAVGAIVAVTATGLPGGTAFSSNRAATSTMVMHHRPNPLVKRASFGWLPSGYAVTSATQRDGVFQLDATANVFGPSWDRFLGGSRFALSMFVPGPEPDLGTKPIAAPPVAGHTAHWLQPPPPGVGTAKVGARLRIQYGPRQWAELELDGAPAGMDVTTTLYKVAEAIRLHDEPTAFPFQVTGVPRTLLPTNSTVDTIRHVAGFTNYRGAFGWRANITFGALADQSLSIEVDRVDVGTNPAGKQQCSRPGCVIWLSGKPNTTIDGHPAYHRIGETPPPSTMDRLTQVYYETLCVYGVHEFDICFSTSHPSALKSVGGLVGLFKQTKVLGPDPVTWTPDPLG